MKHSEKQNKESGKAQIALLAAVVLAAAGAGVWSELHAATVSHNQGSLTVFGAGFGIITDNEDGTATVQVGDALFDDQGFITFTMGGHDPANTSYSQTVSIKPGMSGKQTGSGTGSASLTGDILDWSTFNDTPIAISFKVTVNQAADGSYAFNNHTLNVTADPLSGQLSVARAVSIGTSAYGSTSGSLSILANGAPFDTETGIYGQVESFDSHSVTRLR
jgi:hypothetical protein